MDEPSLFPVLEGLSAPLLAALADELRVANELPGGTASHIERALALWQHVENRGEVGPVRAFLARQGVSLVVDPARAWRSRPIPRSPG